MAYPVSLWERLNETLDSTAGLSEDEALVKVSEHLRDSDGAE